jgi:hypothetical protein
MNIYANVNARWSPFEDARLKALAASGASLLKIAHALRRTKVAVQNRAARIGVKLSATPFYNKSVRQNSAAEER